MRDWDQNAASCSSASDFVTAMSVLYSVYNTCRPTVVRRHRVARPVACHRKSSSINGGYTNLDYTNPAKYDGEWESGEDSIQFKVISKSRLNVRYGIYMIADNSYFEMVALMQAISPKDGEATDRPM